MFNSAVLDVAIGMVFCFGGTALMASSIYEAFASLLKLRAGTLLSGVKALLNDHNLRDLAQGLYNHALVNGRGSGEATGEGNLEFLPSYIAPRNFAIALIEVVQNGPGDFAALEASVAKIPSGS